MKPNFCIKFELYLIRKFLDKDMPKSLPWKKYKPSDKTWDDYYQELKIKNPIKYFIFHTIPDIISHMIISPIDDFIYWFISHINQTHKIDLRQPVTNSIDDYKWGYLDYDRKILYACFNIFVDFVESSIKSKYNFSIKNMNELQVLIDKETNHEIIQSLQNQLSNLKEIEEIYNYWKFERKEQDKKISIALSEWARDKENTAKWEKLNHLEDYFAKQEDEIMIRLMKIRKTLWL